MRYAGKLVTWKTENGYGFIALSTDEKKVFAHINQFEKTHGQPQLGQRYSFELGKDNDGRECATKIILANSIRNEQKAHQTKSFPWIGALFLVSFSALQIYLVLSNALPLWVLLSYVILSLLTYIFYCKDKMAAITKHWRTPENTLHLLALLGGWPGAVVAQYHLLHKTKKQAFLTIFWFAIIIHITLFVILIPTTREFVVNLQIPLRTAALLEFMAQLF